MKKKLFLVSSVLVFTLALLTACLCLSVSAEDVIHSGTSGNLTWTFNETTGELVVSGEGGIYSSPAWSEYASAVKTVRLEDGVNTIGYGAFRDYANLTEIFISSDVTLIGEYAFYNCQSLANVSFEDGGTVYYIDPYAFYGCTSLTSIEIPANVREIGEQAFYGCSGLTRVSFGESCLLTSIGDAAFLGCESLTDVTIPASVQELGSAVFSGCTGLESISFEENSLLSLIGNNAFYDCQSLTAITVPASVTQIGTSAFYHCKALSDVSFEENSRLSSLEEGLFSGCDSLTSLTIPASVTRIAQRAFSGCYYLTEVSFEDDSCLTTIGERAFSGCERLARVSFGKNSQLSVIGEYAFAYCNSLTAITLPSGVTRIEKYAFGECKNLKSITFDHNAKLTYIDEYAFYRCAFEDVYVMGLEEWMGIPFYSDEQRPNLNGVLHLLDEKGEEITHLVIPKEITAIPNYAFSNCRALESVTFGVGGGLTSVGEYAFENCTNLKDTYVTDLKAWLSISFGSYYTSHPNHFGVLHVLDENGNEITDVVLPEGITQIPDVSFYHCAFRSVTIPSSVERIGSSAFAYSETLESVTILSGVTEIGREAFMHDDNLKDVYIDDLESWLAISFSGDKAHPNYYGTLHILDEKGEEITELVIPEELTEIPPYTFSNGTFKSVTFPSGLTSIGVGAFSRCDNVTRLVIPSGVTELYYRVFDNCAGLVSVTIPSSVTYIDSLAFIDCTSLVEIINHSAVSLEKGDFTARYALEIHTGESKVFELDGFLFYPYEGVNYLVKYAGSAADVVLPDSCNGQAYEIYQYAFNRNRVVSVTIAENVSKIHPNAFVDLFDLQKVVFNAVNCADSEYPQSGSYAPLTKAGSKGFSVEFGAKVTRVPGYLFYESNVVSVTFPESCVCSEIGSGAFDDCFHLAEVVNNGSVSIKYNHLSDYALEVHTGESKLFRADGYLFYPYNGVNYVVAYLGSDPDLVLPETVNGESAFAIWKYAFYRDSGLTSITLPSGITEIGERAFCKCENLTAVHFGEDSRLSVIGPWAFDECESLASITIPSTVTHIGDYAFTGCYALDDVYVADVEAWLAIRFGEDHHFYSYPNYYGTLHFLDRDGNEITELVLPDTVTVIHEYAFYNGSFRSVTIPAGVTEIGSTAFERCAELKIVYVSSPVIAGLLTDQYACGSLIANAEVILVEGSVTDLADYIPSAFPYVEEVLCGDVRYVSYSLHGHVWEAHNVEYIKCVQDGFEGHKCAVCGLLNGTVLYAHTFSEWIEAVQPDCLTEGILGHYHCECGLDFNEKKEQLEDLTIPAAGHSYEGAVTAPTCTEQGYTTYTCHCGDSYVADYVEAAGHSHQAAVTAPTCTEQGYTTHTCHCGDSYTDDYREPLGHKYRSKLTSPTCTQQGYTTYTCSQCGDSYVDDYTDPRGHSFFNWHTTVSATCVSDGEKQRDCHVCGFFETQTIPATGHSYQAYVTEPTCTEQGYTTYTCHCGDFYVDGYVDAKGHSLGYWYTVTPATCVSDGVGRSDCTRCGYFETYVLSATGHSYLSNVTSPTCTGQGYTTHTCHCGDSYVDSYVDPTGHTFSHWYTEVYAACTEDGLERRDCTSCSYAETQPIPATGHTYESVVTEPTCTEPGITTYTCHCGDVYTAGYVDAKGHSLDYWFTMTYATCTEDGEERINCLHCSYYETRLVPATGHRYQAFVTEPTCTEEGYVVYTCHCGSSYTVIDGDAKGHSLGNWYTVVSATCTEAGEERTDCLYCDYFETYTVPAVGHRYESMVTEPTCTAGGYTTYTCTACGDVYTADYVDAKGHAFGDRYTVIEGTCVSDGVERMDCSVCGYSEQQILPATGHSYQASVIAPTCTNVGYTEYTCHCGSSYMEDYVDAKGHSLTDWRTVTNATCVSDGEERIECLDCDYYEARVILAKGHSLTDWRTVANATCVSDGEERIECLDCDYYEARVILATGHSLTDWYTVVEATCTTDGEERMDCRNCGYFETHVRPATGHSYESAVTEPTCTEDGYTTYICHCGDSYTADYVSAKGHSLTDWYTVVEATCITNGEERMNCINCSYFETRTVLATGHSYESAVTEPTCTEDGYTTYTCHCGDSYTAEQTPALGHAWDEGVVTVQPTEDTTGTKLFTCNTCGETQTETLPTLDHVHKYEETVVPPTCTEEGYTVYTCRCGDSNVADRIPATGHSYEGVVTDSTCTAKGYVTYTCHCGDYYVGDYIPEKGHDWDEGVVTVQPTEDTTGTKLFTCNTCGETQTETLPRLDHVHQYEGVVTPPTCTEEGYTTYTCRCGDDYTADRVSATGHSLGERYTVTEATCTAEGLVRRDCANCGHGETEVLPAKGHSYESVVTAPTCTEQGYTTYTCTACGHDYVDDYADAAGHAFGEWYDIAPGKEERACASCGETERREKAVNYDADGDGTVTEGDAQLLLSILVGNTETETVFDFDFDGILTIYDCVLLMQQIG